jgi:prevent-host-death family protein
MTKRMTTAEARQHWAKVLRSAERGTPVEVTRNGQPVAAVISIEQLRQAQGAPTEAR